LKGHPLCGHGGVRVPERLRPARLAPTIAGPPSDNHQRRTLNLLAFKLLITPLLLVGASLAIRRWGERIGGFIVGLPLTSGPISVFLALEQGPRFAAQAASGSLIATAAQAALALAWCLLATRGWPIALAGGCASFVVTAIPLQLADFSQGTLFSVALVAVLISLRSSPRGEVEDNRLAPPWWDLPARVALVVSLIVAVTLVAPYVGPVMSGVLAAFPLMGVILALFAHRMAGPAAAQHVMHGMVAGLFGFAVFFYALGLMLPRFDLVVSYAVAIVAALLAQGFSYWRMRRSGRGVGVERVE